jgi:Icc protein
MNEQLDRFDRRPTLVVAHHPPVSRSTDSWFQLEGGDELLAALARKPQVRALISGHLHDPFELEGPGGLALLGCPSTLAAIEHDGDRYEVRLDGSTGARVLRLEDDGSLSSMLLTA